MAAGQIEKGTKVRVRIDGVQNAENRAFGGTKFVAGTTFVAGADGANHYLYIPSRRLKVSGNRVTAEFDAVVTGEPAAGPLATTLVAELPASEDDVRSQFIHYVFLGSPDVTVIEDDKPAEDADSGKPAVKEERAAAATVTASAATPVSRKMQVIADADVDERIRQLEEKLAYDVVRARNGEVLDTFSDPDKARQYIEDEDYDPARVIVLWAAGTLSDAEAEELERLKDLRSTFDGSSYTLYRADYFSEDWARGEAVSVTGLALAKLDDWPFTAIDWEEAAADQRDAYYTYRYEFDGTSYYSE